MEKDLIVNLADYPEWARTALLILANKNFLAACARAPNLYIYRRAEPLRSHTLAAPCAKAAADRRVCRRCGVMFIIFLPNMSGSARGV